MSITEERSIALEAETICAILAGRKTQMRRVMDPQPIWDGKKWDWDGVCVWMDGEDPASLLCGLFDHRAGIPKCYCPYGKPGDRLWVRELWMSWHWNDGMTPTEMVSYWSKNGRPATDYVGYLADNDLTRDTPTGAKLTMGGTVRAAMHMPRWASRITLEITGIRAEPLHNIKAFECQTEGVEFDRHHDSFRGGLAPCDEVRAWNAFQEYWDGLNANLYHLWESNPWVWVLEFQRKDEELR